MGSTSLRTASYRLLVYVLDIHDNASEWSRLLVLLLKYDDGQIRLVEDSVQAEKGLMDPSRFGQDSHQSRPVFRLRGMMMAR